MSASEQLLILNPDNVFILSLTETLGISWWPGHAYEIISNDGRRDIYNDPIIRADPRKKILIKEIPIHDPAPQVLDLTWCDAVIFTTMEMIQETPMLMTAYLEKFYPCRKYVLFGGGHINYSAHPDSRFYFDFKETFCRVVCCNRPQPHPHDRPKLFDVLLGTPKYNRRFIFEKLQEHGLLEKSLVSMHPHTPDFHLDFRGPFAGVVVGDLVDYESPELYFLEDRAVAEFKNYTTTGTSFCSARYSNTFCLPPEELTSLYGFHTQPIGVGSMLTGLHLYHAWCSQIVPTQIYNNTWYSIVSETHIDGDLFSEKTAKVLFARRPFILFGAPRSLVRLKGLGFKTFNSIIDESYDEIEDPVDRFTAAMNSVIKLSKLDPKMVHDGLKDILDHNYRTIIDLPSPLRKLADFISKNLFQ